MCQSGIHVNSAPKMKIESFICAPRNEVKSEVFTKAAPTLKSLYWESFCDVLRCFENLWTRSIFSLSFVRRYIDRRANGLL